MNQPRGSQEVRPPVVLESPGRPGLDGHTSRFEGSYNLLGPKVRESPLLSCNRVQGGFERDRSVRRPQKKSDVLNMRRKIPPASTARPVRWVFAGLSRGPYGCWLSTASGPLPTATTNTARLPTACK
jgi:hypothetical protein